MTAGAFCDPPLTWWRRAARGAVLWLLALYHAVSAVTPGACRYTPTCSAYAGAAVRRHGVVRGLWLALRRVGRCHPLGGWGYDPVPGTIPGPGCHRDGKLEETA